MTGIASLLRQEIQPMKTLVMPMCPGPYSWPAVFPLALPLPFIPWPVLATSSSDLHMSAVVQIVPSGPLSVPFIFDTALHHMGRKSQLPAYTDRVRNTIHDMRDIRNAPNIFEQVLQSKAEIASSSFHWWSVLCGPNLVSPWLMPAVRNSATTKSQSSCEEISANIVPWNPPLS